MVLRARPDPQTCQGVGTRRPRHAVRQSLGGLRAEARSVAYRHRRSRRGGGEAGLSRYLEWPGAAGSGPHPVAGDIAGRLVTPFLRYPKRYRFRVQASAAKTADGEERECSTERM